MTLDELVRGDVAACGEIVEWQHGIAESADLRVVGAEDVDLAALRADERHLAVHEVLERNTAVLELDSRRRLKVLRLLLVHRLEGRPGWKYPHDPGAFQRRRRR